MKELDSIKTYLRLELDDTTEDAEVQELIDSAKLYISRTTRKAYKDNDALMLQALKLLVTHWYTNRVCEGKKINMIEYTHTFTALLYHIELCDDYDPYDPTAGVIA